MRQIHICIIKLILNKYFVLNYDDFFLHKLKWENTDIFWVHVQKYLMRQLFSMRIKKGKNYFFKLFLIQCVSKLSAHDLCRACYYL